MSWRKLEREERIRMTPGFDFINTKSLQQVTLFFLVPGFSPVFFGGQEKEEDAERIPWGSVLVTPVSVLRDIREIFYQEV